MLGCIDQLLCPEGVHLLQLAHHALGILSDGFCSGKLLRQGLLPHLGGIEILLQYGKLGLQILNHTISSDQFLALG